MFYTAIPTLAMEEVVRMVKAGHHFYYREVDLPYIDAEAKEFPFPEPRTRNLGEVNSGVAL
jgi:hypothetical protein